MVVCKYFLQGTCKFGTYCNYEHQSPSNFTSFSDSNRQSASILRQPNFGSAQAQNTKPPGSTGNVDVNTLVKSVVNDMTGAEKGGQWILSCYAPFKEKPAFPGFDDQSPEEIRLGFYEAQRNGTMEQYKAQLQALLQNTIMKIKVLQNPAQDLVAVLQNIYNTPPSSCSGTYGQNVTASTGNLKQQTTFALQTQNKSVFGPSNDNIFKTTSQPNATNIFAGGSPQNNFSGWQQSQGQTNFIGNVPPSSPPNQNIFGSNTYGKTQNSIFGGQQGNNIFANSGQTPSSSSNIFASQALPVSPQSVFGGAQAQSVPQQQPTNIFASTVPTNQNIFSSQNMNQQSLFVPQPSQQTQQQNVFATQNQPQNIQTQNIFSMQNQNQPQNIFSANTNATQFSNSQLTVQSTPPNYSSSIFGYSTNANSSMGFGSATQQPVDESIYSKLEELTDEERKWFESDTLDIMDIPDKPPTYDMCFKV